MLPDLWEGGKSLQGLRKDLDSRIYFILQEEKVKEKHWGKNENGTKGKTELQEKNKVWEGF